MILFDFTGNDFFVKYKSFCCLVKVFVDYLVFDLIIFFGGGSGIMNYEF